MIYREGQPIKHDDMDRLLEQIDDASQAIKDHHDLIEDSYCEPMVLCVHDALADANRALVEARMKIDTIRRFLTAMEEHVNGVKAVGAC